MVGTRLASAAVVAASDRFDLPRPGYRSGGGGGLGGAELVIYWEAIPRDDSRPSDRPWFELLDIDIVDGRALSFLRKPTLLDTSDIGLIQPDRRPL